MKIALFGGSFDPIHNAHIAIIRCALCEVDGVVIMPNFCSPFKQDTLFDGATRLYFCNLVASHLREEGLNVTTSGFEVKQGRPVASIESLRHFSKNHDVLLQKFAHPLHHNLDIYFILGLDSFLQLHKWQEIYDLKGLAKFIVFDRAIDYKLEAGYTLFLQAKANLEPIQANFVEFSNYISSSKFKLDPIQNLALVPDYLHDEILHRINPNLKKEIL